MQVSNINNAVNFVPFKMKGKIIRLNPELAREWFISDRDFLNSTYQDALITSAISKLEPQEDLFVLKVGLPKQDFSSAIIKNNRYYINNSYDMYVEILKNGDENNKTTYDLSTKNVLLEAHNPMDEFENNPEGPCNKVLKFIENFKKNNLGIK